jgi:deoxyhypusine synthase
MALIPTDPVRPGPDVADLLEGMSRTGFQGRRLGESFRIWSEMILDPDCTILLGLSGAMIPAGMQQVLITLAERHYIDAIVSTGANIFHDLCEHFGIHHYLGSSHADDADLLRQGIDRIYDVFAYEGEFREIDSRIAAFARSIAPFSGSSAVFIRELGNFAIREKPAGRSLLSTCVREDIPIFIPALADSSIGIGLVMARRDGVSVNVDQLADADEITAVVEASPKTGVIYIGGGVPKNFIQQTQVIASIHNSGLEGHAYAIQYTTDAPHFGGLSGCTFEEAISWGKEAPQSPRVQVFCDATIALPLVTSALVTRDLKRARH